MTINANGHDEFDEIEASGQSDVTINVSGENKFEEITGRDDANITIRGVDCQKKDVVNLGADEGDTALITERGNLVVDHATVNVEARFAWIGSDEGDVSIDTSKIGTSDESEYVGIRAGGTTQMRESVVDVAGTVHSEGAMTIEHSDVKVAPPADPVEGESPYRVYSKADIKLDGEKNGEVKAGVFDGKKVYYVDSDDNDGADVDLKADGEPAYYRCKGDVPAASAMRALPKTGDDGNPPWPLAAGIASAATAAYALRRSEQRTGLSFGFAHRPGNPKRRDTHLRRHLGQAEKPPTPRAGTGPSRLCHHVGKTSGQSPSP